MGDEDGSPKNERVSKSIVSFLTGQRVVDVSASTGSGHGAYVVFSNGRILELDVCKETYKFYHMDDVPKRMEGEKNPARRNFYGRLLKLRDELVV